MSPSEVQRPPKGMGDKHGTAKVCVWWLGWGDVDKDGTALNEDTPRIKGPPMNAAW